VLEEYERLLGESYEKQSSPLLIFIDEAQYDPKWASVLKSIYDRSNKVFVICTGSSAVSLQTSQDVIRRAVFMKLFPTSFCEYLMIKAGIFPVPGLKKKIKNGLFEAGSAKEVYEKIKQIEPEINAFWSGIDRLFINEYLKIGTLPFAVRIKDENRVYQTINALLDKVVDEDVQGLGKFNKNTIGVIKRILFILAEADAISIQKLHSILKISPNTIMGVLSILEKAELVIRVSPHGSNVSKVRKPSKYLFMSSAIRSALLSIAGNEQIFLQQRGRLMEDIVALALFREYVSREHGALTYDSSQGAADFILTIANKRLIPIEVGLGDKGARQVINTMKKTKQSKYGLIIADNELILLEKENIVKIPIEHFLLM
jgi:predicted AAA+ superfamily ATPase